MEIIYEPHPVTRERKAELRKQGLKIIDAKFDPASPKGSEKGAASAPKTREGLDTALSALPGGNTDPEYVVRSMKSYFGELFTDEDEAKVRELVVVPVKKPSEGLKVDEIKAKLTEKGITFDATANKPVLAKLLDEAPE